MAFYIIIVNCQGKGYGEKPVLMLLYPFIIIVSNYINKPQLEPVNINEEIYVLMKLESRNEFK